MIRLDRYLAEAGLGSREKVKKMIQSGRIRVEGAEKLVPELKIEENALVFCDGERVLYSRFHTLMLHKPAGVLTAVRDREKKTVTEFLPEAWQRLAPVGRLDYDTEGLLLFTDDGDLQHRLLSPKYEVPKTYYLKTDRPIPETAPEFLKNPVEFSDFTSRPAALKILSETEAEITVTEGKFHEVKRLMHAAGADVVYLKRLAFGPVSLGDLPCGETRFLTEEELDALYGAAGLQKP